MPPHTELAAAVAAAVTEVSTQGISEAMILFRFFPSQ
jgi:hypothetical protein